MHRCYSIATCKSLLNAKLRGNNPIQRYTASSVRSEKWGKCLNTTKTWTCHVKNAKFSLRRKSEGFSSVSRCLFPLWNHFQLALRHCCWMTTGQPICLHVANNAFELDSESLWNVIQTASASRVLSQSSTRPLKKYPINGKFSFHVSSH